MNLFVVEKNMKLIIIIYVFIYILPMIMGKVKSRKEVYEAMRYINEKQGHEVRNAMGPKNKTDEELREEAEDKTRKKNRDTSRRAPPRAPPPIRHDKCDPCICEGTSTIFNNYEKQYYAWRNHKLKWRKFYCPRDKKSSKPLIGKIPWQADKNIEVIDIYYEPFCRNDKGILKKQMFAKFTNLELLACSECEASSIEKDILQPHRNTLKEIYFGKNTILLIPVGLHQHASLLQIADWRHSPIEVIHAGTYANLQHLKWACHMSNRIKTIEVGAFKNLPALEFVDLESNMLSFVNVLAFDNYNFATHKQSSFAENLFFCNKDLCPFMEKMVKSELAKCKEPMHLFRRNFKQAMPSIGTEAVQIRNTVDSGQSVRLSCTSCSTDKLHWQKIGTGAIGNGTLPSGCTVKQAEGSRITELVIEKVTQEEHEANYSCYSPSCITAECPIPIISLTVNIMEPVWNLTDYEKKIDQVVRHGSAGIFLGLMPVFIYSIVMVVCVGGYWVYYKIKKKRSLQQQTQQQQEPRQQQQPRLQQQPRKKEA